MCFVSYALGAHFKSTVEIIRTDFVFLLARVIIGWQMIIGTVKLIRQLLSRIR